MSLTTYIQKYGRINNKTKVISGKGKIWGICLSGILWLHNVKISLHKQIVSNISRKKHILMAKNYNYNSVWEHHKK